MANYDGIGILGVGNMGTALLEGLTAGASDRFEIFVYDEAGSLLEQRVRDYDVNRTDSVDELFERTDFVVLCVKPSDVPSALDPVRDSTQTLVSIAAGVPISEYRNLLNDESPIVRVMPNTPAQVGEGMSFLAPSERVEDDFLNAVREVFESVGEVKVVQESDLDAVTALSGSGPAYVFYFLEALKEAGLYTGLKDEDAYDAALQTIIGSAKLALNDDRSPADLRDAVSSPGGTTVEALKVLDEHGVKGKIKEAVVAAFEKSRSMGGD